MNFISFIKHVVIFFRVLVLFITKTSKFIVFGSPRTSRVIILMDTFFSLLYYVHTAKEDKVQGCSCVYQMLSDNTTVLWWWWFKALENMGKYSVWRPYWSIVFFWTPVLTRSPSESHSRRPPSCPRIGDVGARYLTFISSWWPLVQKHTWHHDYGILRQCIIVWSRSRWSVWRA